MPNARLPALMQQTHTPRVIDLPGGFAGLFRLGQSRKFERNYDDPVLVSGTDGVGTKLKLASLADSYETVGIDLVADQKNSIGFDPCALRATVLPYFSWQEASARLDGLLRATVNETRSHE